MHLADRGAVRLDVRPGQREDDEHAGADQRDPPRGRSRLGPVGLDLSASAHVGADRLSESFEHARQPGSAATGAEDQVRCDQVAGGVVEFVGECAQRRPRCPTGPGAGPPAV